LEQYCKQDVPDLSALKTLLAYLLSRILENIRGNIGDAFICVATTEIKAY
jgi:hypothetical protein